VAAALLIIDMQTALVPALWLGEELASRITLVAQRARSQGVPVIAIQQTGPAGTPFDPEDPGWQLSPRLRLQDDDLRLRKSATDSFFRTNLAEILAARDVDTVVITGAATDYCVDATARSALSHAFDVILLGDGHAPGAEGDADLSPEQIVRHHNQILSQAIHPGGALRVVTAEAVFTATVT
jgi:nicotinamidase-related amidase